MELIFTHIEVNTGTSWSNTQWSLAPITDGFILDWLSEIVWNKKFKLIVTYFKYEYIVCDILNMNYVRHTIDNNSVLIYILHIYYTRYIPAL